MKRHAGLRIVLVLVALAVFFGAAGPMVFESTAVAAEPTFSFKPKSGGTGTKVKLTASNLPPGESLTVEGNGKALCSFESGANGKGGCTFKVPKGSKKLKLTITGPNVSRSDVGTFTVSDDKKDNGNRDGGNTRRPQGEGGDGRNGGGDNGINRSQGRLLDGILPPAREFAEQTDVARRNAQCLLGGAPFFGCDLSNDRGAPDPLDNAIRCVGGTIANLKLGLAGIAKTVVGLALGDCENIYTGPPIPDPPLSDPSNDDCALGQPGASSPACLGGPTPSSGNLTPVGPLPEPGLAIPPISSDDAPTFGDILDSLNGPESAPSASMVHEAHDNIRGEVCANVPAGGGGCP